MRLMRPRSMGPVAMTLAAFVTMAGGLLAAGPSSASAASRASITSVVPSRAKAGATQVITGTGLFNVTKVSIHGATARFKVLSATKISVTVPANATSGLVSVTAGSSSTTSPKIVEIVPTVTSFTPASGGVGTAVAIRGTGFTSPCSIKFNTTSATCSVSSATNIKTTVPALAATGTILVTTAGDTTARTSKFTVALGLALSSTIGPPSSLVTVNGTGFDPHELVDLYVGETDEALVASNATGAFSHGGFSIPASTQPGTAWISAVGRRSGLAAQDAFTVRTNWPEQGFGPAHRGTNPYENTLDMSNVGGIDRQWSYRTGQVVDSSAAVVRGVVYVGSWNDDVYALSATTGVKLWSYKTGGTVESSPTVVNGVVYVGSGDDNVYALKATTGAKIWSHKTGNAVYSSPTVVNGVVYVGSFDASIYAFRATTGAEIWSYKTGAGNGSSPAVVNGVVYAGSNGDVYAIDATTGAEIWTAVTGGAIDSSPAVVNGLVYLGAGVDVYAINATTGAEIWSYPTGGPVDSSPAVVNGVVYVGSFDDHLYAINASNGLGLWQYATGGIVDSSPTVANGVVYVGSDDTNVYALDAINGARLWSYATGGAVESIPAVVNGVVYVGSFDGNVYAFSLGGALADVPAQRVSAASLRPNLALSAWRSPCSCHPSSTRRASGT